MRVVIADDSGIFRAGLRLLLESAGITVLADFDTADALLAALDQHRPDVCILDIRMPPTHTDEGIRAAETIRSRAPGTGVVVLSTYTDPTWASRVLADGAGGIGYLLKDRVNNALELIDALNRVAAGGTAIDPDVIAALLNPTRRRVRLATLTDRETEILALMAQGKSNLGISQAVFLSPKTVENHSAAIFTKLGLTADVTPMTDNRRVRAVLAFLQHGDAPTS